MASSASEIADRMRAVAADRVQAQQLLASLFAESIELRHEPGLPSDGPIPGRVLAEVSRREVEAAGRAMPDMTSETQIEVEGDGIRMQSRTTGTLADGTRVDVHTESLLTVANGEITGLRARLDETSMAAWGAVLVAGGFELPDDFLATH